MVKTTGHFVILIRRVRTRFELSLERLCGKPVSTHT
jgi:hypothetical protein